MPSVFSVYPFVKTPVLVSSKWNFRALGFCGNQTEVLSLFGPASMYVLLADCKMIYAL